MQEHSTASPTLDDVLKQFIGKIAGQENKCIRIIDISGLPNEISGPFTAMISRLLFQYKLWQTSEERKYDPILIACEEAHIDMYLIKEKRNIRRLKNQFGELQRRGRKYGIGLMLISQRPSDVESTVLSQCNSWIVLRLTNTRDQEHVAKFLPDSVIGLVKILPSLTRREAIFIGEASAIPSRIKITELSQQQLPDSDGYFIYQRVV